LEPEVGYNDSREALSMATWERIVEKARALPSDKQRQVLDLIELLENQGRRPLKDPAGLLADLGMDLVDEDLAEVRRELWRRFPREV
jgi:hypothetical protein